MKKLMIVVLAMICAISAVIFINTTNEKAADEAAYEALREEIHEENTEAVEETSAPIEQEETYTVPKNLADFMSANKNVIGWLKIDNTKIDYPICQNKSDNEYFLHRDINGEKNTTGSIYMDSNHDINVDGLHVVYGHHMKNGTMFKDISRYTSSEYMEEHRSITILTDEKEIHLSPVACYAGEADGEYRLKITSADELHEFVKKKCGKDIESKNVFVFITCSYGSKNERTYLICEEES